MKPPHIIRRAALLLATAVLAQSSATGSNRMTDKQHEAEAIQQATTYSYDMEK